MIEKIDCNIPRNQFRIFVILVTLCDLKVQYIEKEFIFNLMKELFNVSNYCINQVLNQLKIHRILIDLGSYFFIVCKNITYKKYTFERLKFSKINIATIYFKEYEQIKNFIISKLYYR